MLLEAPRSLPAYPVALRKFHQRYSSRDEVADAAQDVDSDMVRLGDRNQAPGVEEADVAGDLAGERRLPRVSRRGSSPSGRPGRCGQRITSSIITSVSEAIRSTMWLTLIAARDVMDEKQQPADADQRQQHRPQHRDDRRERVRERMCRRKRGHAVGERAEKDPSVHCVTRSLEKLTMMAGKTAWRPA